MAPIGSPEKTAASGSYYPVPPLPPRPFISGAGYVGLTVLGLLTLFLVIRAVSAFSQGGGSGPVPDGYDEVDLGQVTRELLPDAGGLIRDSFMLKVVLVLNPKLRDLPAVKVQVERRRNLFRDIVLSEIINPKTDEDLRKPAVVETLKAEIRDRLNRELDGARDGHDVIARVIFPERRLPERR